jgi:hypothetical protein
MYAIIRLLSILILPPGLLLHPQRVLCKGYEYLRYSGTRAVSDPSIIKRVDEEYERKG